MSVGLQLQGNGRCAIPALTWRNWGKPRKTSAKITFVPVEIQTDDVVNTSLEPYHFGNPLGLRILNHCSRWTSVLSFTLRPLYPREEVIDVHWVGAGWAPEPVWTLWRKEKFPFSAGNRNPILASSNRWPTSCNDKAVVICDMSQSVETVLFFVTASLVPRCYSNKLQCFRELRVRMRSLKIPGVTLRFPTLNIFPSPQQTWQYKWNYVVYVTFASVQEQWCPCNWSSDTNRYWEMWRQCTGWWIITGIANQLLT
jgi:hypothetical protein